MGSVSMQILLKRALLLFGASMLTAMLLDAGLKSFRDDSGGHDGHHHGSSELPSVAGDSEPWNGGKPQPRVGLSGGLTPIEGEIFEFAVEVEPGEKCDEFSVRIRGIDGVTLAERRGDHFVRQAPCSEGLSGSVRVRVPRGTTGAVVVDVEMRDETGRRSVSRSFLARNGDSESVKGDAVMAKSNFEPVPQVESSGEEVVRAVEVQ